LLWLATAAVAGALVMALEMASVRLLAPYFGYSIYVWGTTIGVVMAAMVAGYAVGGRLADGERRESHLHFALLASAAWQLLALWTMRSVLPPLAETGEMLGVTLAVLLLFAPALAALAAAGPILVRLCADVGAIGRAAGLVSALSTAGSIAGILATTFWLLPELGTRATLQVLCGVSFSVGAAGLLARSPRRRAVLLAPAAAASLLLALAPGVAWSEGSVWIAESSYNVVRVVQRGGQRVLQLNHPASVHSVREAGAWTGLYYDAFALGPLLVPGRRALVLGMGAGGNIRSMRLTAPEIEVDAVEIDPRVVDAARLFFGIEPDQQRLRLHVMDARRFLARNRGVYDLVQLDVYQGGPYIPFHIATEEFFRLARARMSDDALLMMNVFDAGSQAELLGSLAATLRQVFPCVMAGQTDSANHMLFAFTRRPPADRLENRPGVLRSNAAVRDMKLREVAPRGPVVVFTDDNAPIEEMTRRMLGARAR
jgi:spermidine synthase